LVITSLGALVADVVRLVFRRASGIHVEVKAVVDLVFGPRLCAGASFHFVRRGERRSHVLSPLRDGEPRSSTSAFQWPKLATIKEGGV
jgi:hypothetical protein